VHDIGRVVDLEADVVGNLLLLVLLEDTVGLIVNLVVIEGIIEVWRESGG
jgi:hypothetical protein